MCLGLSARGLIEPNRAVRIVEADYLNALLHVWLAERGMKFVLKSAGVEMYCKSTVKLLYKNCKSTVKLL